MRREVAGLAAVKPMVLAGKLDRRITFQSPLTTRVNGRPTTIWPDGETVWAQVADVRPSKAEQVSEGLNMANRPCRVVIRYRSGITPGMRFTVEGRTLHVVSMPAELGRREGIEFMAEELTTAGHEP